MCGFVYIIFVCRSACYVCICFYVCNVEIHVERWDRCGWVTEGVVNGLLRSSAFGLPYATVHVYLQLLESSIYRRVVVLELRKVSCCCRYRTYA
jgi:hypothetical protein